MSILQKIKGHDDLITLDDRQRTQLCGEIREFLISNVSKTGGHLAGNLGVVELSVAIEPGEAYGEYSAELVATLNRSMFEGVDELEVGMQFHASGPDGGMQIVTIRDIEGDDVIVDGNHPLAGQRLNFQVKVVNVRDAHAEELAHGHIHGEGGHHH